MFNKNKFMENWIEEKITDLEFKLKKERNNIRRDEITTEIAYFKGLLI